MDSQQQNSSVMVPTERPAFNTKPGAFKIVKNDAPKTQKIVEEEAVVEKTEEKIKETIEEKLANLGEKLTDEEVDEMIRGYLLG